jgi:hypothetical protein
MPKPMQLPHHLPAGSKYVIECRGKKKGSMLMHHHVELPDGRCVTLAPRVLPICRTLSSNSKSGRRTRRGGACK